MRQGLDVARAFTNGAVLILARLLTIAVTNRLCHRPARAAYWGNHVREDERWRT